MAVPRPWDLHFSPCWPDESNVVSLWKVYRFEALLLFHSLNSAVDNNVNGIFVKTHRGFFEIHSSVLS